MSIYYSLNTKNIIGIGLFLLICEPQRHFSEITYLKVIKGIDEENRNPEKNPVFYDRFSGKTRKYGPKIGKTTDIWQAYSKVSINA